MRQLIETIDALAAAKALLRAPAIAIVAGGVNVAVSPAVRAMPPKPWRV